MNLDYKHFFQDLCNHIPYNTVVFLKQTGDVIAYRSLKSDNTERPKKAILNIDYSLIPLENSRIFYGVNLTLDHQVLICSGSVHIIDLHGSSLVIFFFDSRVKSFRDHQLPRIFWKTAQGVYLGHSDYVPYESNLSKSMIGLADYQLFDPDFLSLFKESDEEVTELEIPLWNLDGRIIINQFQSLVTLHKIPYYSLENQLLGLLTVYLPISTVEHLHRINDSVERQKYHTILKDLMMEQSVYFVVFQAKPPFSFDYYTDNLSQLGYEMNLLQTGILQFRDLVQEQDRKVFDDIMVSLTRGNQYKVQTTLQLITYNNESITMECILTAVLNDRLSVEQIAVAMFTKESSDPSITYEKQIQDLLSTTHVIYTIRKSTEPFLFLYVSKNIDQFGVRHEQLLHHEINFFDLIHPDDQEHVQQMIDSLTNGQSRTEVMEYRLRLSNTQTIWVREIIKTSMIESHLYLESAIWNVTSSHLALETLKTLPQSAEINPDAQAISFTLMSRYLEYTTFFQQIEKTYSTKILLLNNQGNVIYQEGFPLDEKEAIVTHLKSNQADHMIPSLPYVFVRKLITQDHFVGYVELLASSSPSAPLEQQIDLLAQAIAILLHAVSIAMMTSQSSSIFQGDLNKQRLSHSVLLELLNIANNSKSTEECFSKMMPLIHQVVPFSRASIFHYQLESDTFSCAIEWITSGEKNLKNDYQNVSKKDSLYQDWNLQNCNSYVIHSDTLVPDVYQIRPHVQAVVGVKLATKEALFGILNIVHNQRHRHWSSDEVILLENVGYILSSVEEKARKQATIRKGTQQYFRTLDSLPSPSIIVNPSGKHILFSNKAFRVQFIQGLEIEVLEDIMEVIQSGQIHDAGKEMYSSHLSKWFMVQKNILNFINTEDALLYIFTDITVTKEAEAKMQSLAYQDVLTSYPNRLKFEHDLRNTYSQITTSYGSSFIGLVNIDNFKLMNNSYGYSFGDELLKEIIRKLDSIPEIHGSVYRFGGDEFSFIVKNSFGEQIYEIAHKVMQLFETPFLIAGYEVAITISLGLVFLTESKQDVVDLVRKVNLSVNDAKASGKNKFVLYDASLRKYQEDTLSIELALKRAVKSGLDEFHTVYQPIVDVQSQAIVSCEALMRWNSSELGQVSPVKFIPIAETSGLIIPLGNFILEQAIKQIRIWLDQGFEIAIAVNFSVVQMLQSDLVSNILKLIQKYRVPPRLLTIEITESLAMNDINKVIEILNALKGIGVKIAIDDFGTGYSSLNHLRKLPLDYVKIDRSFIFNIDYDPYTVAFVETITKFCHLKNTKVCCEGVETLSQQKMLEKVRVDLLQGYLFSKPIIVEEMTKLLSSKRPQSSS